MQRYQQSGLVAGERLHNELRKLAPDSLYDHILVGVAYSVEGKFEEALAAYNYALESDTDALKSVFILKGETLTKLKRYDEAVATLDEAIALAPENLSYYEIKAIFLLEIDRLSDVISVYNTLLQKRPRSVEILLCKSLACFLLGQTKQAWSVQRQIFSMLPDPSKLPTFRDNMQPHLLQYTTFVAQYQQDHAQQADAWYFKGLTTLIEHEPSGPFNEALSAFLRAIDIDSKHAWAWNGIGIILMAEGRHPEAVTAFVQASKLLPTVQSFAQNRNKAIRAVEGKVSSHIAARSFKQRTRNGSLPHFSPLEIPPPELLEQLMNEERFDEALQVCEQLVSVARAAPGKLNLEATLWLKARLLYDLQRIDEATVVYREILQQNPAHAQARSEFVDILVASQRFIEALEILAINTTKQEEDENLYERRAGLLLMLHRYQESLESANRAHALNPTSPSISLVRIETMRQLGQTIEALEACEKALHVVDQRTRAFPLLLLAQADLYLELGRPREALPIYEEALRREQNKRKQKINNESGALLEGFGLFKGDVVALMLGGMGNAWLFLEDGTKAIEYYDQALALGPDETFEANRNQALALLHRSSNRVPASKSPAEHVRSEKLTRIAKWVVFLRNKFP